MYNINYDFFDEFKKLDKLCKEIYGNDANNRLGITLYIEDMEKHSVIGKQKIRNWNDDYYKLKRIRHLRNELAHSDVSFSSSVCTQTDLDFTRNFYSKMINRTDPISLLAKQQYYRQSNSSRQQPYRGRRYPRYSSLGCLTFILLFALIAILAASVFAFII